MPIIARSHVTTDSHSYETGKSTAERLLADFGGRPQLALVYLTINHQAEDFLRGFGDVLGDVSVLGCSAQGVMGHAAVHEEGFAATALLLGGDTIELSSARAADIASRTFDKGRSLGEQLRAKLREPPKFVVLNYDPLCGVNMDPFLAGVATQIECPIVGGGASQTLSDALGASNTLAYFGREVSRGAAVAFAGSGDFHVETEVCHGCSPVGVEMVVTRSEGSLLLELDGRAARDTWAETCGPSFASANQTTALAIGVPAEDGSDEYLVRAAYSMDERTGGVSLGAHIPEGTHIMLHHRTTEDVLEGAERMGMALSQRLAGRAIRAVFGYECGARTRPFLGDRATRDENLGLQRQLGRTNAWIGMMPWGELFPVASRPAFHNYSYPILAIAE